MNTTQIYQIVNDTAAQAMGSSTLAVVDVQGLISLGNTVLSSSTNTEAFLNTLAQRIGRTILRFREYRNKLGDMVLNDFEYGAILQKIKVVMPTAEEDQMYDLTDGQSVDHYVVAKPDVQQKLFVTRTPYQFHITIQRETLKEAFLTESAMGAFIGVIFGEVRNALEVSLENLSRVTLATAIAECAGTARQIDLVSEYNDLYNPSPALDEDTALNNPDFMRYAMSRINSVIDAMQDMSVLYNDGSVATFTPKEDMRVKMLSSFKRRLETVVEYAAFHDQFVRPDIDVATINYWQAADTPSYVSITRPSDSESVSRGNVVCLIHDRDAMGVYKIDEDVLTSPVNAAGSYYNTYWHEKSLRFLDLSENFICFTLN